MACLDASGAACTGANGWACDELPTEDPLVTNISLDSPVVDDTTVFKLTWTAGEVGADVQFFLRLVGDVNLNEAVMVPVSDGAVDIGTGMVDGETYVLSFRTVTAGNLCSEWNRYRVLFTGLTLTLIVDGSDVILDDNSYFIIDG